MDTVATRMTLRPGHMLDGYRIERTLGEGGFGVTYLAHDTNLDTGVAIKEYFPLRIAVRGSNYAVCPASERTSSTFNWGLDRFVKEARTLAKFTHPNIVRVKTVLQQNQTAYIVMELEHGQDLQTLLCKPGRMDEETLLEIMGPLIDGLSEVHRHGFIHRDIKPENIHIRLDNTPVLLDFGSARQAVSSRTQSLTAVVTVGFAPLEQYNNAPSDKQGPWTDIYSLGAVLYHAIMGHVPTASTLRGSALLNGDPDPLAPISELAQGHYSDAFLESIDWAMRLKCDDRPQNLEAWRARLTSGLTRATKPVNQQVQAYEHRQYANHHTAPETANVVQVSRNRRRETELLQRRRRRRLVYWSVALVAIGATALFAMMFVSQRQAELEQRAARQTELVRQQQAEGAAARRREEAARQAEQTQGSLPESAEARATDTERQVQLEQQQAAEAAAEARRQKEREQQRKARAAEVERLAELEKRLDAAEAKEAQRLATLEQTRKAKAAEAEQQAKLEQQQKAEAEEAEIAAEAARQAEREQKLQAANRPISNSDITQVNGIFNALKTAIEGNDLATINRMTIASPERTRMFTGLFDKYESIEVSLSNISSQRANQSIRAILSIERMVKSSGDIAFPSKTFKTISLKSVRDGDQWSLIYW